MKCPFCKTGTLQPIPGVTSYNNGFGDLRWCDSCQMTSIATPQGKPYIKDGVNCIPFEKIGVDSALDSIGDIFEILLRRGHFEAIDDILKGTDTKYFPADFMLTYLVSTKPAKSKLPSRADFVKRCIEAFKVNCDNDERVWMGLE